jgi:hypothetical protein
MRKLMFSERHDAGYEGDRSALWNEENYVVSVSGFAVNYRTVSTHIT